MNFIKLRVRLRVATIKKASCARLWVRSYVGLRSCGCGNSKQVCSKSCFAKYAQVGIYRIRQDVIGALLRFFFQKKADVGKVLQGFLKNFGWKSKCFLLLTGPKVGTVKLGVKEHFDKEQIGVKEAFPVTNCQFTSQG